MQSDRQYLRLVHRDMLRFIHSFREQYGEAPNTGLLARHFGWKSHQAAIHHLRTLEARGFLEIAADGKSKYRTARLTAKGKRLIAEDGSHE